ncbi:hypothetical protein NCAS_0B02480 [Naumovozyma castellii]|uniref:C2H2-type domain-containing protein n=1 Tax=Naumovozyma castellii TaxID=27288 RepID=G0VBK6_NAUCA|nr:hypothetical protein NCAS_0B02480 [Naumovozyma castellii CBS 4309]CCC68332.1 hypothetical protein NCAS_0B02480 [Naumovozyma castellii CBS 4309]
MSEDALFFKQAAEAIVSTSLNISNVDPTIRELLNRIKVVNSSRPIPNSTSYNAVTNTASHEESIASPLFPFLGQDTLLDLLDKNITTSKFDGTGSNNSKIMKGTPRSDEGSRTGFQCNKCELYFIRSSDLRRHEKTHLSILPNICSQCGKGFARKDALKRYFGTLTCKRNRNKLLNLAPDGLLEKANLLNLKKEDNSKI